MCKDLGTRSGDSIIGWGSLLPLKTWSHRSLISISKQIIHAIICQALILFHTCSLLVAHMPFANVHLTILASIASFNLGRYHVNASLLWFNDMYLPYYTMQSFGIYSSFFASSFISFHPGGGNYFFLNPGQRTPLTRWNHCFTLESFY